MARPQATKQEAIADAVYDHQLEQQYEAEEAEKQRQAEDEDDQAAAEYEDWHAEQSVREYTRQMILQGLHPTELTPLTRHEHRILLTVLEPPISYMEEREVHAQWSIADDIIRDGQELLEDTLYQERMIDRDAVEGESAIDYTDDELASLMNHIADT